MKWLAGAVRGGIDFRQGKTDLCQLSGLSSAQRWRYSRTNPAVGNSSWVKDPKLAAIVLNGLQGLSL